MRRGGIQAVPHFHCHRRYGMCTIARGSRASVRSVPAPGTGFVFFAFAGGIYAAPTNARYRFCHPNRCTPGLARFWGRDRVCLMRRGGIHAARQGCAPRGVHGPRYALRLHRERVLFFSCPRAASMPPLQTPGTVFAIQTDAHPAPVTPCRLKPIAVGYSRYTGRSRHGPAGRG